MYNLLLEIANMMYYCIAMYYYFLDENACVAPVTSLLLNNVPDHS